MEAVPSSIECIEKKNINKQNKKQKQKQKQTTNKRTHKQTNNKKTVQAWHTVTPIIRNNTALHFT